MPKNYFRIRGTFAISRVLNLLKLMCVVENGVMAPGWVVKRGNGGELRVKNILRACADSEQVGAFAR